MTSRWAMKARQSAMSNPVTNTTTLSDSSAIG